MVDDTTSRIERRGFLKATGAAGAAVALGGVAQADSSAERDIDNELIAGVSASHDVEDFQRSLPSDVEMTTWDPALRMAVLEYQGTASSYRMSSVAASVSNLDPAKYTHGQELYYTQEAEVDDPRLDDQYAPQIVDAPEAWDESLGSREVVIGVVDTGVDYEHPDLQSRFGDNKGYDFVDDDENPMAEGNIHATHVCGIAAGATDNGTGIAGMSNSRLISCRALDNGGRLSDIAQSIRYCADQGADIINMSLGGGGFNQTMKDAVSYALNNGALPIAAAGNNGSRGVSYPAGYEECVAVSATDSNDQLTGFSQYGEKVEVAAPGAAVLSSVPGGDYRELDGTSMACPAAAGVAALGAATNDVSSPSELRQLLKDSAEDVGLSADEQGAGRVNAGNIVGTGGGSLMIENLSAPGSAQPGDTITVKADVVNDTSSGKRVTADFRVNLNGDDTLGSDETLSSKDLNLDSGASQSISYEVDTSALDPGTYTHGVVAGDATATARIEIEGTGGGGECGDARNTASEEGTLSGTDDSQAFAYTLETEGPCTLSLDLSGDGGTDFDLYLTLDGRTPTPQDFDRRSYNYGSDESITVEEGLSQGQEVGILVNSYRGAGSFELAVEELGDGGGGDDPEPDPPECGDEREVQTDSGTLYYAGDYDEYTYVAETSEPCQVTVATAGPDDADFELYLRTADGSFKRSEGPTSDEVITLGETETSDELTIYVYSRAGAGAYELGVEEIGK